MSGSLLVARERGIVRLTMNRPQRLNALTAELLDALTEAIDEAARDDEARVVLVCGAGRAFCAGQDLGEDVVAPGGDLGAHVARHYKPLVLAIRRIGKPVVARVNGVAAGAGANLAFACDIVLAARSAQFIESFARIGLLPDTAGTWMLPRLIGHARATAVAMLGTPLSAQQAYEWGAIWRVVDDEALDAQCDELAAALAKAPTKALGAVKRALSEGWTNEIAAQLDLETDLQRALGASNDFREGVDAFSNKREPVFRGE